MCMNCNVQGHNWWNCERVTGQPLNPTLTQLIQLKGQDPPKGKSKGQKGKADAAVETTAAPDRAGRPKKKTRRTGRGSGADTPS